VTVLDRFNVGHAGHASSVHFFRKTDLVPHSWPNAPDADGRRVALDPFPEASSTNKLAQHRIENIKDVVTLHPSYADFLQGVDAFRSRWIGTSTAMQAATDSGQRLARVIY